MIDHMNVAGTAGAARRTRVLIVDDHPILRHGIAQLVGRESDFEACFEAGTIDEALALMDEQPTDVVIVDLSLEEQLRAEFKKSLQVSLEVCKEKGIPPELHEQLAIAAQAEGKSINKLAQEALRIRVTSRAAVVA